LLTVVSPFASLIIWLKRTDEQEEEKMFELEKQAPTGPTLMTTIEQSGNRCQTISLHSSCRYCLLVYFWCRHFFQLKDT
jgi:hypothetical protein